MQDSVDRIGALLQATGIVSWEADPQTRQFRYVHPHAEHLLGYPVSQWYEQDFWAQHICDDDRTRVVAWCHERSQIDDVYQLEYRMRRADGGVVWVEDVVSVMREEGRPIALRGLLTDITARKQTEELLRAEQLQHNRAIEALRESEERFEMLADAAPVMIWMSGTDKHCIYFNRRWLDFTGRTMEEERGEGWVENVHPEDRSRCITEYGDAFDARRSFVLEYRLRRFDGEYRWITDYGSPRYESDGEFCGYIGSCIDSTERIVAERAIRESEGKFRALFDLNVLPIAYWHKEEVVDANDAFLQLIGCGKSDLQGTVSSHPIVRDTRHALAAEGQRVVRCERDYRLHDGRELSVLVAASLLPEEDDRGVVFVVDLTERKRTEQTLRELSGRLFQAQERERTTIARELHDDIGQRVALLCIELEQLARRAGDLPDDGIRLMQELKRQTREIATDLQHISHGLYPPKLEHLGLLSAIKALCGELSAHKKVRIEVGATQLSTSLPRSVAVAVYRVVQEALHNRVKHSRSTEARVELHEQDGHIDIAVCDSGIGFDPDALSSKAGIGLVSMRERVRLVRGTLAIESHRGHGTSIRMRIPLDGLAHEKGESP